MVGRPKMRHRGCYVRRACGDQHNRPKKARPRAVGELVVASGLSYSATSQHLSILRRAGLVSSEASGRRRIYRLRPAALEEVHDWSARYSEFWRGRLQEPGRVRGEAP